MSGTGIVLDRLSEIVEKLGPSARTHRDTWLGKRAFERSDLILPVRLWPLGPGGTRCGPAHTARLRDISEQGLGLTAPCQLDLSREFQVELFADIGTWIGRMKLVHCTQTIGGYKLGLELQAPPSREEPAGQHVAAAPPSEAEPEALTVEQALAEIQVAMRKYHVNGVSRGLLGMSAEKEISRLLHNLPAPPDDQIKVEPRRQAFRYEVEGRANVMISTAQGRQLLTTDIGEISADGARLVVQLDQPEVADPPFAGDVMWQPGTPIVMGVWTEDNGTLWLPARIVYCLHDAQGVVRLGVQFTKEGIEEVNEGGAERG